MALYEINPNAMRGSGTFTKGRAGEALGRCQLIYKNADGSWYLADADLAASMPTLGLTMDRVTIGQRVRILVEGYIGSRAWVWATGGELYATSAPGVLAQVPPAAPSLTQIVGIATRTNMIKFDPTMDTAGVALTGYIGDYTYKVIRVGANYTVYNTQGAIVQGPGLDADVAINWALNAGGVGCVVYLTESATYAIDDPIAFTANSQVIRGGGRSSFIDGDALADTEHGIVLSAFTDCQIRNLSIQTQDGGAKSCHAIFIEDGANRFLIEDVTVVESDDDGIHIEGTTITQGHIHKCSVEGADGSGIFVDMDAGNYMYRLHVKDCDVGNVGSVGIRMMGSSGNNYCEIVNNVVYSATSQGILVYNFDYSMIEGNICVLNTSHGVSCVSSTNIKVADNLSYSNGNHGIIFTSVDNSEVKDNLCVLNDSGDTATWDGIHLDTNSDDNLLGGNQCSFNHRHGIYVIGDRNQVIENKVWENDEHGMVINGADCQINDNHVEDNSQDAAGTSHGIYIMVDGDRATISDNHINGFGDSQEDGIHLADGALDCLIEGNHCQDGMGSGIVLTANNDDCSILGNYLMGNDDYGVEITAASCDRTRVFDNTFNGNVTGQFLDSGTDTATPEIPVYVSTPDTNIGTHPGFILTDEVDVTIRSQMQIPAGFQELVTAQVLIVPGGTGNLRRSVATNFAKMCGGENYDARTDSIAAGEIAVTINFVECIDVAAALTGLAASDIVGMEFTRVGTHLNDTVGANCYYLGTRVRYV